jgi:hypothetical protein
MHAEAVITFENLKQRTDVVGEYKVVSAKAKPFVSQNAKGTLREIKDYEAVGELARAAGMKLKEILAH